ncbi:hypothetical protein DSUL_140082 [Desulfovibrionales bacterium]
MIWGKTVHSDILREFSRIVVILHQKNYYIPIPNGNIAT